MKNYLKKNFDKILLLFRLKTKKKPLKKKDGDINISEGSVEPKPLIDTDSEIRLAKREAEGLRPIKTDSKSIINSMKRVSSPNSLSSESSIYSLNKPNRRRKVSSSASSNSSSKKRALRKNRVRISSGSDHSSHQQVQDASTDFDSDCDEKKIIKSLKRNKISDLTDEEEEKKISKNRKDSDTDSFNTFFTTHTTEDVVITDITSGVVTVTIKECISPDGFFKQRDT